MAPVGFGWVGSAGVWVGACDWTSGWFDWFSGGLICTDRVFDEAWLNESWIALASGDVLVGLTAWNGELLGSCCCRLYASV